MVRDGGMGAQISPEVYRIMKAIFSGVISEAAIMRSPSFSRERSSRTTMNSPFSGRNVILNCSRKWRGVSEWCWKVELTECGDCVFHGVELLCYFRGRHFELLLLLYDSSQM